MTKNKHKSDFGRFVRETRLSLNKGLREFARMADISPAYLSRIEVGDFPPPSEENIKKMANILNVDEDKLLAMAGKVSSELQSIIISDPVYFAKLLRQENVFKTLAKRCPVCDSTSNRPLTATEFERHEEHVIEDMKKDLVHKSHLVPI